MNLDLNGIFTMFPRLLTMDGDNMFQATEAEVTSEHRELARKQGVTKGDLSAKDVLLPSQSVRLRLYMEKRAKGISTGKVNPKEAYIVDLDQSMAMPRAGCVIPTLVRHGCIYSVTMKDRHLGSQPRMLTSLETLLCQGIPVYPHVRGPFHCSMASSLSAEFCGGAPCTNTSLKRRVRRRVSDGHLEPHAIN